MSAESPTIKIDYSMPWYGQVGAVCMGIAAELFGIYFAGSHFSENVAHIVTGCFIGINVAIFLGAVYKKTKKEENNKDVNFAWWGKAAGIIALIGVVAFAIKLGLVDGAENNAQPSVNWLWKQIADHSNISSIACGSLFGLGLLLLLTGWYFKKPKENDIPTHVEPQSGIAATIGKVSSGDEPIWGSECYETQ